MTYRVLIVEDEYIVATEIEDLVSDMGHEPVGIAGDQRSALALASQCDIALVDLNLRDGPTGQTIGRILAQTHGVTVVFITANPSQLGDGVPGTVGVLPKPATERDLRETVEFAVAKRIAADAQPPRRLRLFDWDGGGQTFA
ncbi:CheY chemotaxis protein or a CheY-like REC (receiver) domain [Devosia lucknowensis]|uniref:CheY chemotaxis protein or a CheY-like REC (Receiver) domain n=1 Tax=Devosia lucknowensis TaxID=1096929 RepID=A0A1Y6EFP6_9HYPH|nr:response regulator [Devosia lucknowensis]SMQ61414.1 CheY chemotaxis protein or a CheY-like REC (receiver) domain [Devosia lucknowensis]